MKRIDIEAGGGAEGNNHPERANSRDETSDQVERPEAFTDFRGEELAPSDYQNIRQNDVLLIEFPDGEKLLAKVEDITYRANGHPEVEHGNIRAELAELEREQRNLRELDPAVKAGKGKSQLRLKLDSVTRTLDRYKDGVEYQALMLNPYDINSSAVGSHYAVRNSDNRYDSYRRVPLSELASARVSRVTFQDVYSGKFMSGWHGDNRGEKPDWYFAPDEPKEKPA